jgi:cytoskeleton protein RodZ
MTTGQRLKQAREAQNISLDDVARRTNIRLLFLEAIESDDLALIPSSHQRLFVREFAKVLGMDPNEALADLPEVSPAVVAPEVA